MKRMLNLMTKLFIVGFLVCSFVFFGFSAEIEIPKMTISTGSVGAGWFTTCASIAEWVNEVAVGYPLTAVPGGGGIGNPTRIFKGDSDIGVSYALFLGMAMEGETPYTEKHTNLRALFSLTSNSFHLIVDDSIDAKYLEDIITKKIGIKLGTAFLGDSDYFVLEKIFGELGVEMDVLEEWGGSVQLAGTGERVALWQDRHIDAIHSNIEYPAAAMTEVMASRKGKLLGLTEPIRDTMVKNYGFVKTEIPLGTYPNQDYSVPTIRMPMVLFTTADAPMEAIYLITKVVAESEERFKAAYGAFKTWKPEQMVEGLGIQIHEGALKYYRERGWVK